MPSILPDSDTEPDSDEDRVFPDRQIFSVFPESSGNEVIHIAEIPNILTAIDLSSIAKDPRTLSRISRISNTLNDFLDHWINVEDVRANDASQLARFMDIDFFRVLFDHRTAFYAIAASETSWAISGVVSWVDVVLTKIADCAVNMRSGGLLSRGSDLSDGWRIQRYQDNLRGASQLPATWDAVTTVIFSKSASPAAKRVAMRLLFSACVLQPSLIFSSDESSIFRAGLVEPLQRCVLQTVSCGLRANYASDTVAEQERINFATMIALFATASTADAEGRQSASDICRENLKPHTLSCILDLLQIVMYPDQAVTTGAIVEVAHTLDTAQWILIADLDAMFWLWDTWKDLRLANAQVVTLTTATWIAHNGWSVMSTLKSPLTQTQNRLVGNAILNVLLHFVLYLSEYHSDTKDSTSTLSKCCLAVGDLLRTEISSGHQDTRCRVDLCKTLLLIFALVGESDEEILAKELLLETIVLFRPAILNISATLVMDDSKVNFVDCVKDLFDRCAGDREPVAQRSVALNLYVALRHLRVRALDESLQDASAILLRSVADMFSRPLRVSEPLLLASLFFAVTSGPADLRLSFRASDKDIFWNLAIQYGCEDIYMATGFARYILTVETLPSDAKSCLGAWDYIRDAFMLILRGRFSDEQEPLAILVSPVVCDALRSLLQRFRFDRFITTSPWSITLRLELTTLLTALTDDLDAYHRLLQSRLMPYAKALVSELEKVELPHTPWDGSLRSKLVACRTPDAGLIVVPIPLDGEE